MTSVDQPTLYRTAGGAKLHLRECPHLVGGEPFEASADDLATRETCVWSQHELTGAGRTYHDTIEAALADMGADQASWPALAVALRQVEHDTIFVPFSRSYVALQLDNVGMAWAGKTYVNYPDRPAVLLPDFVPGKGGGAAVADATWGDVCPVGHVRSRNGSCYCD